MIYVIDNFVSTSYFHEIQEHIDSPWQEWYYQDNISFMEKKGKIGYFGFNPSEVNTQLLPLSFAYGIIPIILRIPAIIFAENIILKD